jgi:hypothetical protein
MLDEDVVVVSSATVYCLASKRRIGWQDGVTVERKGGKVSMCQGRKETKSK